MSKPDTQLDYGVVDTALYYGATIKQLKFLLAKKGVDISERTIQRAIERDKDKTFTEYRDEHKGGLQLKLTQKAVEMALNGNVSMLIFCLKNLCGWSDKQETEVKNDIKINIDKLDSDL